jgi:hypothetical protein
MENKPTNSPKSFDNGQGKDKQLEALKIDLKKKIAPPEIVWKIQINGKKYNAGTKGNFSVIIGKAKSKKTFLLTLFLADYLKTEKVKNVLYFDTEQSEYDVSKALNRICIKNNFIPENIKAYHLRSKATSERLELIEHAIYNNDNFDIVIIDGIRDLINSINDEEQATMINSKLLKWTEEKNIHIITVLHQNKGDNNARGHVGTELMNKSELVLSVSKSDEIKDTSLVETVVSRNIEIEEFAFQIDQNGIPNLISDWTKPTKDYSAKNIQPHQIPKSTYNEILAECFKNEAQLKYQDLVNQIYLAIQKISGVGLGNTKLQKTIVYLQNEQLINKHGKDRSPKAFYTIFENTICDEVKDQTTVST